LPLIDRRVARKARKRQMLVRELQIATFGRSSRARRARRARVGFRRRAAFRAARPMGCKARRDPDAQGQEGRAVSELRGFRVRDLDPLDHLAAN